MQKFDFNIKTIEDVFKLIAAMSEDEKKDLNQLFLKLLEEVGELSQELLIAQNAPGLQYKSPGKDGPIGEGVDVAIIIICILYKMGATTEQLIEIFKTKLQKWNKISLQET